MVLNPTVLILQFCIVHIDVLLVCLWCSEVRIVLAVKQWPGWRQRYRQHKFWTTTWEQLVVCRGTWQCNTQVDVVTVTIGDEEVAPITQHIAGVCQLRRQLEVVVRPAQALAPTQWYAEELDVLVLVHHRCIVIVATVVWAVATIVVVVVIHPCRVAVGTGDIALLWVEGADAQCIRALATKPSRRVACWYRAVVATVRLERQWQLLAITDRHDAAMHLVLSEEVTHGEVVQLDTDTSDDTRLSPT